MEKSAATNSGRVTDAKTNAPWPVAGAPVSVAAACRPRTGHLRNVMTDAKGAYSASFLRYVRSGLASRVHVQSSRSPYDGAGGKGPSALTQLARVSTWSSTSRSRPVAAGTVQKKRKRAFRLRNAYDARYARERARRKLPASACSREELWARHKEGLPNGKSETMTVARVSARAGGADHSERIAVSGRASTPTASPCRASPSPPPRRNADSA